VYTVFRVLVYTVFRVLVYTICRGDVMDPKRGRGRPKLRNYPQVNVHIKLPAIVHAWAKQRPESIRELILQGLVQTFSDCPKKQAPATAQSDSTS